MTVVATRDDRTMDERSRDMTIPAQPEDPTGGRLVAWAEGLAAASRIGTALCATSFVPAHFRGKPNEAAAAILYGDEIGFTPTQALQNLYVINGKPALYARAMVALVQSKGHSVWTVSKADDAVTVAGQRRGSEHVVTETWDTARAQRAGYASNKKYQTDPQAMLYARAASDVCRQVAADALAGIGYSVEEMDVIEGGVLRSTPAPVVAKPAGMAALRAAASAPEPEPKRDRELVAHEPSDSEETGEAISDRQRRAMFALFTEAGFETDARSPEGKAARLGYISAVVRREVESSSDLTTVEASRVIDALRGDADERNTQTSESDQ